MFLYTRYWSWDSRTEPCALFNYFKTETFCFKAVLLGLHYHVKKLVGVSFGIHMLFCPIFCYCVSFFYSLIRPTRTLLPKSFPLALLVIWFLLQPTLTSSLAMGLKQVLQTMLQVGISITQFSVISFYPIPLSLNVHLTVSYCFSAYCTGLLLARRVLKLLEMDSEYEGNVEVFFSLSIFVMCYVSSQPFLFVI